MPSSRNQPSKAELNEDVNMRVALAAVVVLILSVPTAAQDERCDARPRWLVVTVVSVAYC